MPVTIDNNKAANEATCKHSSIAHIHINCQLTCQQSFQSIGVSSCQTLGGEMYRFSDDQQTMSDLMNALSVFPVNKTNVVSWYLFIGYAYNCITFTYIRLCH
jgi:hypothetical protein